MWKLIARISVAQRTSQRKKKKKTSQRRYFLKYIEINGNTIYQNLWDAVKQCNRKQDNSKKKLIKKKDYKPQIYNIMVHFKGLNEAQN